MNYNLIDVSNGNTIASLELEISYKELDALIQFFITYSNSPIIERFLSFLDSLGIYYKKLPLIDVIEIDF